MNRKLAVSVMFLFAFTFVALLFQFSSEPVRGKSPAKPLSDELTPEQALAQDLALSDPAVIALTTGKRSEVFGVRKVGLHYPASASECAEADCRQVEIYNFNEHEAVTAIVNLDLSRIVDVLHQPGVQPGINKRLSDLALDIALNHPDVIDALGFQPTNVDMAPVDGGLVNSQCGSHVCAVPTFNLGDRNLWVIIDLTEERLLDLRWTDLPEEGVSVTFEPEGCTNPGTVTQGGWSLNYETTGTDGLRIFDAAYNGVPAVTSIKLVEWHVAYGGNAWGFEDVTGCGGGGFQIFPFGDVEVIDITGGFELRQDFRMPNWGANCNYRYEQRNQFYDDGRFRVIAGAFGRDCGGGTAIYRPLIRIDLGVSGVLADSLASWDGANWMLQPTEYWEDQGETTSPENYRWLALDASGAGFYIEPDNGQFGSDGASDDAYFYAVAHHPEEGDTDLGVIGDCCATGGDYQQGPHMYLDGESISGGDIVFWYISQSQANAAPGSEYCWTISGEPNPVTFPCFTGPMFHPVSGVPIADFEHPSEILVGTSALFMNTSTGDGLSYLWDFGDGVTSTVESPTYVYNDFGVFTATLTASNITGTTSVTSSIRVIAGAPEAAFSHDGPTLFGELTQFANLSGGSPPLSYLWNFGDGTSSTAQHPAHLYHDPGTYTVTLTVSSPHGEPSSVEGAVRVGLLPAPSFEHSGPAFLTGEIAIFTNTTTGTMPLNYLWFFGDGDTSSSTDPTHIFSTPGMYTVTLRAFNVFGDQMQALPVTAGDTLAAGFKVANGVYDSQGGIKHPGVTVRFENVSIGEIDSFAWDFGDGIGTSSEESPIYEFNTPGIYFVELLASNESEVSLMRIRLEIQYSSYIPVMKD